MGLRTTAGEFSVPEGDNIIPFSGGISDSTAAGSPANPTLAVAVSGSYAASPDGSGSLTLVDAAGNSTFRLYVVDRNVNIFDPDDSPADFFGGGGSALMLHTDPNINGTGVIIQNASPGFPPFVGYNALQLTNASATSTTHSELDLVGAVPGRRRLRKLRGFGRL